MSQAVINGTQDSRSLFGNGEFRLLFCGAASSKIGVQVGYLAVPLVAVLALNASPGQVGLLAMLSTSAFLLIGLPAGAWVDRLRRRRVMIIADLVRGVLFASVPIAWWLDALTIEHLYAVVFASGFATVFFDVGNMSYLPHIVGRDRLVEANSAMHSFEAVTNIAGRSAAGYLVQMATAPAALVVTACGYFMSSGFIARIRRTEPQPSRDGDTRLLREIGEGLGFVVRHPILRAAAIAGSITNFGMQICVTMLPVLFVAELGIPEGHLGLFFAAGGFGALLGALSARRLGDRLGQGRVLWVAGMVIAPVGFVVPMIERGVWTWLAGASWLILTFKVGVDNVILVSFRQRLTPDQLLGRQNATMRFLLTGMLAIGSGVAAVVGQAAGPRAALWLGAAALAVVWVPLFLSPIRTIRELPEVR